MKKAAEKNSIIEMCPIRNVIARFGNKWSFLVIMIITEMGLSLLPLIEQMTAWAQKNMKSIVTHREAVG